MTDSKYDPVYGKLLTDEEVASRLGWKVATLWTRRSRGRPVPAYVKFSDKRSLTPESEVTKFITKHLITPSEDKPEG